MKAIKLLGYALVAMTCSAVFVGCGDDDNEATSQQGGQQGAVGGQLLTPVVNLRQIQQNAGAGGGRQDQDAALEYRIRGKGQYKRVAEEGEYHQLSCGVNISSSV